MVQQAPHSVTLWAEVLGHSVGEYAAAVVAGVTWRGGKMELSIGYGSRLTINHGG